MADAVGIPLVSVTGPCNMQETRPLGKQVILLQRADLPCAPCAHIFHAPYTCRVGTRACIREISAIEITKAVSKLLESNVCAYDSDVFVKNSIEAK
jgi:ADP-heptose:LPS heptosyltransferase